ncbi:filamin-A-like [Acanthaster planci]|uniref:Filamin-A-like n=1 Tax=Acanthaster planci TaxID=133434 RepID=A0A8B7YV78_ACAPL|nr:filamin-A-like [Acanthaster planci]
MYAPKDINKAKWLGRDACSARRNIFLLRSTRGTRTGVHLKFFVSRANPTPELELSDPTSTLVDDPTAVMPDSDPTAADAEWKKIQQNTFTRWINEQLKPAGKYVYNVETDLGDGLILIALLDQLIASDGRSPDLPRCNKRPVFKSQRLENISIVLKKIEDEQIRLVNIDASDILKGNLKLILGLIWTLILKYQISLDSSSKTPKQAMLEWINTVLPDRCITNFTTDWNDGIALSALINFCDPTLLTNVKSLDPASALDNCTHAIQLAKDKFEIPQILDPADMNNPKVDELSVMTYLSYFPRKGGPGWKTTLNWVRNKVPELNVQNFQSDWNDGRVLCALAEAVAEGACPEWRELNKDEKLANCQKGIEAGTKLGIKPTLSAQQLMSHDVKEHDVLFYAVHFQLFELKQ